MKKRLFGLGLLACLVFGISAWADSQTSVDSQNAQGTFTNGNTFASIYVSYSDYVFTADDGTQTERIATILSVFFFGPEDNFSGCYVIPDEDFVLHPRLHSAVLRTTVSGPSNCGQVARADGQPLDNAIVTAGPGVAADLQIDVQWNYYGSVGVQHSKFSDRCDAFSQQSDSQGRYAYSAGIGRVASSTRFATAPRLAASFARLSNSHSDNVITGIRSLACGGFLSVDNGGS